MCLMSLLHQTRPDQTFLHGCGDSITSKNKCYEKEKEKGKKKIKDLLWNTKLTFSIMIGGTQYMI